MGRKVAKRYYSYSLETMLSKLYEKLPYMGLHKMSSQNFEILILNKNMTDSIFEWGNAMLKLKLPLISKTGHRRAKRALIWAPGGTGVDIRCFMSLFIVGALNDL